MSENFFKIEFAHLLSFLSMYISTLLKNIRYVNTKNKQTHVPMKTCLGFIK